jgi:hypothetical protein
MAENYSIIHKVDRIFLLNNFGLLPINTKDKAAMMPDVAAATVSIFPYPMLSLRAPPSIGPAVRPAQKKIELNP